jgi:transcriptional regulator with XRE-family HTH domain
MLRDNLKAAINKSGLIVKEIAAKSGVKKRTIDKWVGIGATEPKVNDLYKVCKVLSVTMEWVVDGEAGSEYVGMIMRNDSSSQ